MANFNFNKVTLGGRITADPELAQTQQGTSSTRFTIAVNRRGSKEQVTDFINCVAWRDKAELISKYFKKGNSICVVGNIQVRTWNDKDNNKRYATEVIIDEVYFVDSKSENTVANLDTQYPTFQTQEAPKFEEIPDDQDLPF